MRQEIIKIHKEALQYIDEYLNGNIEGKVTNKTVRVYMDSEISDLPVREQIQRVINVLEEQIEMEKPKMTYKEELQAEVDRLQLQLDKNKGECAKLVKKINCAGDIPAYKTIYNQLFFEFKCKVKDSSEVSDKIQRLEAKINIL